MTYNFPLLSTANEGAVATLTNTQAGRSLLSRVIPFTVNTQSNQTLTISIAEIISDYKDYADQAQSNYANMSEMGTYLGKKLGERAEALSLANFVTDGTDFGDTGSGVLGLSATPITPSATNIDDIVRGVIQQIQAANGWDLYMENGGFIVWQPQQWTFLVQYMQSMGFTFADESLRDGGKGRLGKETMGLFHYVSTSHTTNHIPAGVRKCQKFGILASTYGKVYKQDNPASSTAGSLSGTQIHTRLDCGFLTPTNLVPVTFDINVVSVS